MRLVDSDYWAEASNFGHKYRPHPEHYVRDYERLLTGGIWAQVDMRFEYDEETKGKNPFWIDKLTPIQIATFDLEEYRRRPRASSRPTSGSTSWCGAWATSPREMSRRLKLLFLVRLIPLAERNYNLVELGPRGTGKSYVVQEVSPYAALLTGPTTVANLFGHMTGRQKGMVQIWDVVGFDEVADLQKMPKEVITTMKTYCESGTFQRGQEAVVRRREHRDVRQHQPADRRDGADRPPVRADAGRHPRRHGVHRPPALLSPRLGDPEDAERALHRPLRLRRRLPRRGAPRDCGSTTSPRSSTGTSRWARTSTPATARPCARPSPG